MKLPKIDFEKYNYPLRTLLLGNSDTWQAMSAVIEDLTQKQFAYQYTQIKQRSIAQMLDHAMDTQYGFYTKKLVMGEDLPPNLYKKPVKTVREAQKRIAETFQKTVELWEKLTPEDFQKEIQTEWGQVLTGELALFQSITHTHYHVSEICFLRGLGGFPTTAMG
ncbi:MAG: hypothetical protein COV41_02435 [Candidatus Brennerbacteria bacterium CG11_big_fil_rev_8_21_14_0_20_43_10]|uniref:DinB-like domain-containing protein n=2 Tax=Candidatus Brenneribacteriota TaxID=1817902 RepID=A0A2M8C1C2_9BACT|nr:MAG: hypothetical protein COV41_02435 [Candidatus Brennerbacteria bacterium CG11_big_fil_rev_8_21_14_0_20_43_10]PJB49891.1 MAG: hypothetical protein CO102_02575 [Candidatus Brennerbacteria bacterium CG_4_9_14_3_um_filter_43_9]